MLRNFLTRQGLILKVVLLFIAVNLATGCGDSGEDVIFPSNNAASSNPLRSLQVVGGDVLNSPGSERQFVLLGTYDDGTVVDLTEQVTWTSSDPRVFVGSGFNDGQPGLVSVENQTPAGTRVNITATDVTNKLETSVILTVGQFLYTVGGANGLEGFSVDSFAGEITSLGTTPVGPTPRGLVLSPNGRFIYTTNQGDGTVSAYRVNPDNGSLSEVAGSPYDVGASALLLDIEPILGRFLAVTDSSADGDFVHLFEIDEASGALTPTQTLTTADGLGPQVQGIAFSPRARLFFVTSRGDRSVSAFAYSDQGDASLVQGSTSATGTTPGNAQVDPNGRFLYVTNFGGPSTSAFAIGDSGSLTEVAGSPFVADSGPQFIAFDATGRYLFLGAQAGSVVVYAVDLATGALSENDAVEGLNIPRGLAYNEARGSLYVLEIDAALVRRMSFDESTGFLSMAEAVATSFERPFGVVITP